MASLRIKSEQEKEACEMATSTCIARHSRTFGIAGLALLLGSGLAWAGPPNPTPSDGQLNTAGGSGALQNTTGFSSTGFGYDALFSNGSGIDNTASGAYALYSNTTGNANTASGVVALSHNTTGIANTANGVDVLWSNTTGSYNTASGYIALYSNTTGSYNTAHGIAALYSNTEGIYNTASGFNALVSNTTGAGNTVSGVNSLNRNTTGNYNTASGFTALASNTTGAGNTAVGLNAGRSNTIGTGNTFIGYGADANAGSYMNGTALGAGAMLTASNSIVLGNAAITKIYAKVMTISAISDRRRKKGIRALNSNLGLDFIEKLKPVSYRFNDGDETERYGFIAQDLEQALPASLRDIIERSEPEHGLALIERQNDKDRTYRVSYGELFAPIVKSIQEQQQEIEAERQQNADLRHALAAVEDQVAALKAQNDALRHSIEILGNRVIATR